MKFKIITIALILSIVVAPSVMARADDYDVTVIGTGDYLNDVANVQAAVDNYDKILLTGTFDFGDWGTVSVTRDGVEIHGERAGGQYITKIIGGHVPFLVGSTATGFMEWVMNPDAIEPVTDFSVEDIFFENPMYAVAVLACHGELKISGNRVVDGRTVNIDGNPHNIAFVVASVGAMWDPSVITADTTISDNYIDAMGRSWATEPPDPQATYSPIYNRWYRGIPIGIFIIDVDAQARITGNEIRNTMNGGIMLMNHQASEIMAASVTGNILVPSPSEIWGDPFDVYGMSVYAAHNQVEVANPNSWGVACASCFDSVYEQNRIHYDGLAGAGISLVGDPYLGEVTNVLVRSNDITGQGTFAVGVVGPASENTFAGNNINGFTPVEAHYFFLGANHNVVAGQHGTVIDLGVGNRITGLTKTPGGIGGQISDAMRHRIERWREATW
jgi:hypothetical protein